MTLIRLRMALIRKHARSLLIASTLCITAALAQEIELYGQPDFRGSRLGLDTASADLAAFGARNDLDPALREIVDFIQAGHKRPLCMARPKPQNLQPDTDAGDE